MITTRDLKPEVGMRPTSLRIKTTKEIDVHVKTGKPQPTKIAASTHTIEDVADIAEKKRRDEIMAARQVIMTGQKAAEIMSAAAEQGKTIVGALASTMKKADKKEEKLIVEKGTVKEEEKQVFHSPIVSFKNTKVKPIQKKEKKK